MWFYRSSILILLQLIVIMSTGYSQGSLQIEQRFWNSHISASGRYVSPAWSGNLDLNKDLGFKGSNIGQTSMIWNVKERSRIRMDYLNGLYNGSFVKTEVREFFGGLIRKDVHHHVAEEIQLQYVKLGWIHYNSPAGNKLRTGFLMDIKSIAFDGSAALTSKMDGIDPVTISKKERWRFTAPTVGVLVSGKPNEKTEYFMECSGLTNGPNGFLFIDYEAGFKWYLGNKKNTSITLGYRGIEYRNYQKTASSQLKNVKMAGLYYGIAIYF